MCVNDLRRLPRIGWVRDIGERMGLGDVRRQPALVLVCAGASTLRLGEAFASVALGERRRQEIRRGGDLGLGGQVLTVRRAAEIYNLLVVRRPERRPTALLEHGEGARGEATEERRRQFSRRHFSMDVATTIAGAQGRGFGVAYAWERGVRDQRLEEGYRELVLEACAAAEEVRDPGRRVEAVEPARDGPWRQIKVRPDAAGGAGAALEPQDSVGGATRSARGGV